MKKTIAVLLMFPLILVACGKEKTDSALNGYWHGEVTSSRPLDLRLANQAVTEIVVYKFDGEKIQTYRVKESGAGETQVEVETGIYESEEKVINFNIAAHSCAGINSNHPTKRKILYKISDDKSKLTVTLPSLKKITLTKVEQDEAKGLEQVLLSAEPGCFSDKNGKPGDFKPSPIEKPTPEIGIQDVDDIEQQAKEELAEVDTKGTVGPQ